MLELPREVHGQRRERLTGLSPGRSSACEIPSDTLSPEAATSADNHAKVPSNTGTIASNTTDFGSTTFSQDNLYSGEQFRYGIIRNSSDKSD